MSAGRKLATNAIWLVAATTLNKVIAFLAFIIVARLIGPSVTGTYFYAVSVTSVFVTLADLGLTPVIIRAVAHAREDASRLLGAATRVKLVLAPIAILCALGYGVWQQVSPVTMATIAVACLVMTCDTVSLLLYGSLRGRQDLKPESIGMFVGQVLTACGAITAALVGWGAIGLAVALLLGSLWNVFWSLIKTREFKIHFSNPLRADYKLLSYEAVPFAISGIAVKLYSYADSLFIHAYQGAAAVGEYAVAYKLTYALQFLPLTFSAALYPALANAWARKAHAEVKSVFLGSLRLMAVVGFPVSAGLSALAPRLIPFLYGNAYLASVPVLVILPWVLLPIFLDFPVGSLLNGSHRAHLKTNAQVATMFINVVLNAILVPKMGPVGAAWAGLIGFWALYVIGMCYSAKDAGGFGIQLSIVVRGLAAAAISWIAWSTIGNHMPLLAAIVFGSAVAIVCAFVFRLVTVNDLQTMLRWRKADATEDDDIHAEDFHA